MNTRIFKSISLFITLIFSSFMLASCASDDGSFPQMADAPPFDYVDGEELRSRMHQLAFALTRLDNSLTEDYDPNPTNQRSVIDSLDNIERIGQSLQDGDLRSQHPVLLDSMERFMADVERAQFDAERNRYYMAGRIAGACVSCHRSTYE